MSQELPHSLYIQNYSSAATTCLLLRKWVFNPRREAELSQIDDWADKMLFYQAIEDVNRGQIDPGKKLYELKALQDVSRLAEYIDLVRQLPGYGYVSFPHCPCDSRKKGHVVISVGFDDLKLKACSEQGEMEGQVIELAWDSITSYRVVEEENGFQFAYARPSRPEKSVTVFTPYVFYLKDCFDRIRSERGAANLTPQQNGNTHPPRQPRPRNTKD